MGKLYLIEAAVDADYTWLGVAIAIGTMISLAYYLRVVAAVWMRPAAEPRQLPGDGGRLARGRRRGPQRRHERRPKGTRCMAIIVPCDPCAGGDDLLRRHPVAARRLGHARRRLHRAVPLRVHAAR